MSKRKSPRLTILIAVLTGVFLGAGAVQYAGLTASSLVAMRDAVYRNHRSVDNAKEQGIEDAGNTGIDLQWRTDRVEKAPAVLRGAALEQQRYCPGQSALRRSTCLINEVNKILKDLEEETSK